MSDPDDATAMVTARGEVVVAGDSVAEDAGLTSKCLEQDCIIWSIDLLGINNNHRIYFNFFLTHINLDVSYNIIDNLYVYFKL